MAYDALIAKWPTVAGATTEAKLEALRAEMVTGPAVPMVVSATKVFNLIVPAEFTALTQINRDEVYKLLAMGELDASQGTHVRSRFQSIFTQVAAPLTRAALASLAAQYDAPQVPWLTANGYPMTLNTNDLDAAGLI